MVFRKLLPFFHVICIKEDIVAIIKVALTIYIGPINFYFAVRLVDWEFAGSIFFLKNLSTSFKIEVH